MCGIIACISKKNISEEQKRRNLADLRTLLLYNVDRGKDATGLYGVGTKLIKDTVNAYEFLKKYRKELPEVASHIMIGHTRNSSVNHTKDVSNAHPIVAGKVDCLVHNGTLKNWTELRKLYDFDYKDVDMDSKLLAFALDKLKNFEVFEKYDGTANVVWHHADFPEQIFVYKDPDKTLFYGRKNDSLFISSIQDSLLAIDIDDKDIYTFRDNAVSILQGTVLEKIYDIKRDPLKATYTNNTTYCYDNKSFGSWYKMNEYKNNKFRQVNNVIVNWDRLEPTAKTGGNNYDWDVDLNMFIRKDLYQKFHNCRGGATVYFEKENAYYLEGVDKKKERKPYTGLTKPKGKASNYYVNGKEVTLLAYEAYCKEEIDKAEVRWLEIQEKDNEERKNTIQSKNAGCPVPRIWGTGSMYYANGHHYSGLYKGLLDGDTLEGVQECIQKLVDDLEDMEADPKTDGKLIDEKKKELEAKRELLKVYVHKLRKHVEDPTLIGKYFLHGCITTKEVYEESLKKTPIPTKQTQMVLPEYEYARSIQDEMERDDEEISDDKLVEDEADTERQEKLEELAEKEQEVLETFSDISRDLATLDITYKDIDTNVSREIKATARVIGEALLDTIQNNILQRKNVAGDEFEVPDCLIPMNIV